MGIIKAAVSSVSGTLADSWEEAIEPDNLTGETLICRGIQMRRGKGANKKGTDNIISNGSVIHVYPNTMMILVDSGKIVDYSAQEGYYTVSASSAPSLFNGELSETVRDTWERFKFGGVPSSSQKVFYINLAEIKGFKFGTRNAVNYFDNFYNSELFLRAHGSYSVKITDPLKFFSEFTPDSRGRLEMNDVNVQLLNEFLDALQSAINNMSVDGVRISAIASKSRELSKYMANALDEDWRQLRGLEICSVGIASISYDEESKKLINMRNQGAMMSDPALREGYVQSSLAQGFKDAGSNSAGAGQAYMAMGMGMNAGGGFMNAASSTNAAQMQQQRNNTPPADNWKCSCGAVNTGNFCQSCGGKRPAADSWKCSCGTVNTGNFCGNCGAKRPSDGSWRCSCGAVNTGAFCTSCGNKRNG